MYAFILLFMIKTMGTFVKSFLMVCSIIFHKKRRTIVRLLCLLTRKNYNFSLDIIHNKRMAPNTATIN